MKKYNKNECNYFNSNSNNTNAILFFSFPEWLDLKGQIYDNHERSCKFGDFIINKYTTEQMVDKWQDELKKNAISEYPKQTKT